MELTLYGITKEIQVLEELWEMAIDEETGEIKDSNVLEELQSDIEVILQEKSASNFFKTFEVSIAASDSSFWKKYIKILNATGSSSNLSNSLIES